MREMDFTEKNLFNRLCGVNNIWRQSTFTAAT